MRSLDPRRLLPPLFVAFTGAAMIHKRGFLGRAERLPEEFGFLIRVLATVFYMALQTGPFSS